MPCALYDARHDAEPVALPDLRLRAVSPRQRVAQERYALRDGVSCLQPVQRDVPESGAVRHEQHCESQHRGTALGGHDAAPPAALARATGLLN